MNTTQKVLVGALVVQAGLALWTWTGSSVSGPAKQTRLIEADASAVRSISISGKPAKEGEAPPTVELRRKGDDWVVTTAEDFPAKRSKVESVVTKLVHVRVRKDDPLASKASKHNALRVGDKTYSKRVVLGTDAGETKLVVGSSSGSRINVRFEGQDPVYLGRGIAEYALSHSVRSYIDTEYVHVPTEKITAVSVQNGVGQLDFQKNGERWELAQLPAGRELDDSKARSFVSRLASVSINEPVGKAVKPEYGLDPATGAARVTLQYTEDDTPKTVTYVVGAAKDDNFYVKADGNDYVILAGSWATEQTRTKKVDDLLKKQDIEG